MDAPSHFLSGALRRVRRFLAPRPVEAGGDEAKQGGLGDDPDSWPRELAEYMRRSSPEGFALAEQKGLVDLYVGQVVEWGRGHWTQIPAQAADAAQRREALKQALQSLIGKTFSEGRFDPSAGDRYLGAGGFSWQGLGDDPDSWGRQLAAYMRAGSPEGFAAAERDGKADVFVGIAALWGRRQWDAIPPTAPDAAEGREQVKTAMMMLVGRVFAEMPFDLSLDPKAMQRQGTPLRHIDRGKAQHVLSYNEFAELNEHHKAQPTREAKELITEEMVQAFMGEPSYARLLDHPVFVAMGEDELYLQALGAVRFGSGDLAGAAEALTACLDRYPSDLNCLFVFNALRAQGKDDEAFAVMEKGIRMSPEPFNLKRAYAAAKFSVGDVAAANAIFGEIRDRYLIGAKEYLDKVAAWNERLQEAIRRGQHFPSTGEDVYTDEFAISAWWTYWYHFARYSRYQNAEGAIDEIEAEFVADFITSHNVPLKQVIEVGTMCAEPLYHLAQRFTDCEFVGVDRQPALKEMNDRTYKLPNMRFEADDIGPFLESSRSKIRSPSMLLHVRTSPFFYPAGLVAMYEKCFNTGIDYIALFEHYGFSYVEARYLDFDLMEADGEARSEHLTHHNYRRALDKAGYDICEMRMLRPISLFTIDGNSLFLAAKRRSQPATRRAGTRPAKAGSSGRGSGKRLDKPRHAAN